MLPKKNRVDKKNIDLIFKSGKFLVSPDFTVKFIKDQKGTFPRVSFIVPKSLNKLAVKRNLLRRRGYTALNKNFDKLPNKFLGVFIFKKYEDDVLKLENEIKNLINKIN